MIRCRRRIRTWCIGPGTCYGVGTHGRRSRPPGCTRRFPREEVGTGCTVRSWGPGRRAGRCSRRPVRCCTGRCRLPWGCSSSRSQPTLSLRCGCRTCVMASMDNTMEDKANHQVVSNAPVIKGSPGCTQGHARTVYTVRTVYSASGCRAVIHDRACCDPRPHVL